jgi:outer membrane protein OmpA-like peptidoglycan-associated protein
MKPIIKPAPTSSPHSSTPFISNSKSKEDDFFGRSAKTGPPFFQQQQVGTPAPLPPPRKDKKTLTNGVMSWEFKAISQRQTDINLEFKPDKDQVEAKNISFVQTAKIRLGATPEYGGNAADYQPYEESTGRWVDQLPQEENDPFYGAKWDEKKGNWAAEGPDTGKPGNSKKGVSSESALLHDAPLIPGVRKGRGDLVDSFETVPTILETGETLGALTWGYNIEDKPDSPVILTGARQTDCVETPSDAHTRALDKFYEAKFDAILDSFAINSFTLTPDHKTKLDRVATKLKSDPTLKVELGGATDLTGAAAFNRELSLKRANAAKAYLLKNGVTNTITVQSYGADWARVKTSQGTSEEKNRRVQVRVFK